MAHSTDGEVRWTRRYPPLSGAFAAAAIAILVLPSALNVPQSNPTQTLEFAPIPPDDDDPPPPEEANLESLSLGSSSTTPGEALGADGPGVPPPPVPGGVGERPVTKRCVGSPPRQTEDRLSPPCVAHFEGDNGGATHRGVTEDEIRIILHHEGGYCEQPTSRAYGSDCRPYAAYEDLWEPPSEDDSYLGRTTRALQDHFNDRYQMYGRRLHVWVYFGADGGTQYTPEIQRSDALENFGELEPFAVVSSYQGYRETMADLGVLVFGGWFGLEESLYKAHPGFVWGYQPSVEQSARLLADYVCTKVVPHPVSFSGNGDLGERRVFGMLHRPSWTASKLHHDTVKPIVEDCGATVAEDLTYTTSGNVTSTEANSVDAASNVATFQQAGVTTVLWSWGWETGHSAAAARIGYRPEWVLGGDTKHEGQQNGNLQEQSVWDGHVWAVTHLPLIGDVEDSDCYRAMTEASPGLPEADRDSACRYYINQYNDLRLISTGVQVAGPRLTTATMEQGFRAIPAVRSDDPSVPACFFAPGDYTCIKDGAAWWYDADGSPLGSAWPGCWRLAQAGARYFPGTWPDGDVLTMRHDDTDPCSGHSGAAPI